MTIAIIGEAIIDFIANPQGEDQPHLGGSPYNVAIGLARNGESVSYLSPFSSDNFGELMRTSLLHEGVQIPLQRRSRYPTSLAIVTNDVNKQPSYTLYREGIADKDIALAEITAQMPADLTVLHTGSLAITPSQLPKIRELLQLMQRRSIVISLDLNIRLGASLDAEAYLEGVRSLMPYADLIKASDEDLAPFQFAADTKRAAQIAHGQQGKGIFVLTQGARETVLFTGDRVVQCTPPAVVDVQDTVGAGDTFYAAFLACLRRNGYCDLQTIHDAASAIGDTALLQALKYANAAAAINVTRSGCAPPTRAEVQAFLDA